MRSWKVEGESEEKYFMNIKEYQSKNVKNNCFKL